jgi:hypothetical protein
MGGSIALSIFISKRAMGTDESTFEERNMSVFALRVTQSSLSIQRFSLSTGGETHRQSYSISLNGEDAEATLGKHGCFAKSLASMFMCSWITRRRIHVLTAFQERE